MVDLNRRIGVLSASQGGFSSRGGLVGGQYQVVTPKVSPEPVPYAQSNTIIVYSDGAALRISNPMADLDAPVGLTLPASGGRFDEPYVVGSDGFSSYTVTLGGLSPGDGPFTLETWYRVRTSVAASTPSICGIMATVAGGNPYGAYSESYFDRPRDTCNHFYGIVGGNGIEKRRASAQSAWRHFAMCRNGTSIRGYDNGNYIGDVWFGNEPSGVVTFQPGASLRGHLKIDLGQLRYIKGAALYSGDPITLPSEPFINV